MSIPRQIAIVDDDPLFCDELTTLVERTFADRGELCSIETFSTARALLNVARSGSFDLYLIDVLLDEPKGVDEVSRENEAGLAGDRSTVANSCTPAGCSPADGNSPAGHTPAGNCAPAGERIDDGIKLAERLRAIDRMAGIVFVTNSLEHTLLGYSVDAAGYLLKPIDRTQLAEAIDRALRRRPARSFAIETPNRTVQFTLGEVLFLEARNHTLAIRFSDGHEELVNAPLSRTQAQLPHELFVACHRSYVVNVDAIRSVQRYWITLQNGEQIPVSRSRYQTVLDALLQRARTR